MHARGHCSSRRTEQLQKEKLISILSHRGLAQLVTHGHVVSQLERFQFLGVLIGAAVPLAAMDFHLLMVSMPASLICGQ